MSIVYSDLRYVYPGPHVDESGLLDERVWFAICIGKDEKKGIASYLVFPQNAKDHEIAEQEFSLTYKKY